MFKALYIQVTKQVYMSFEYTSHFMYLYNYLVQMR